MVANLLLLGGRIGKPGAGILPVRGHSNVQGQRTVGITEKPELVPLDKLKALYDFEPPRDTGLTTVETCRGLIAGSVKAIVSLGGNLLRAVPDGERVEQGWRRAALTVQIATKLNRSHVMHGQAASWCARRPPPPTARRARSPACASCATTSRAAARPATTRN